MIQLILYFLRLTPRGPYLQLHKLIMFYYKTYLLLLYFILFLNMTTLLEPAAILTEELAADASAIFNLPSRIPMFLPSGAINPEY